MTIITTTKELRPRQERDFYPTEPALVDAALKLIRFYPDSILDPGCGDGAWGKGAKIRYGPLSQLWGVDIEPSPECDRIYDRVIRTDFLKENMVDGFGWDLIIGNPPYKLAMEFVQHSLSLLSPRGTLMFLLRLSFLASRKRAQSLFKADNPTVVYVLSTRPSFTGDGKSDDNEYGLFLWDNNFNGKTTLHWYDWERGIVCA
jgi:hypothetical protein